VPELMKTSIDVESARIHWASQYSYKKGKELADWVLGNDLTRHYYSNAFKNMT